MTGWRALVAVVAVVGLLGVGVMVGFLGGDDGGSDDVLTISRDDFVDIVEICSALEIRPRFEAPIATPPEPDQGSLNAILRNCDQRETGACRLDDRATTVPRTEVIVWFRPHTDEDTIRDAACELKESPLVASVYVSPGEPEEPPRFPSLLGPMPPGVIEVTAARPQDAEQIRASVLDLPNSHLLDGAFLSHIDE